jgi:trehalose 6-phosphate phosphatase
MRYILSSQNRQVLRKFASSKTLIAFDFDGTLAPIVSDPRNAVMRRLTKLWLADLAALYPTIVISGRARKDVRSRLRGIPLKAIVGSHGIEPWSTTPAMERAVKRWLPLLRSRLRQFPGVAVENKRFSVAIHYRQEPHKQAARAAIAATVHALGAVRCIGGKQVVNIFAADAPHKGHALNRELSRLGCTRAIYIGDDDTDEDVFAILSTRQLLTIRVGLSKASLARYYIRNQREIDRLMQILIELRSSSQACPTR